MFGLWLYRVNDFHWMLPVAIDSITHRYTISAANLYMDFWVNKTSPKDIYIYKRIAWRKPRIIMRKESTGDMKITFLITSNWRHVYKHNTYIKIRKQIMNPHYLLILKSYNHCMSIGCTQHDWTLDLSFQLRQRDNAFNTWHQIEPYVWRVSLLCF